MDESELLECLCQAILDRDLDDMKKALAQGANPNGYQTHTTNQPPMNLAASVDFVAGLEVMHAAGGLIDDIELFKRTPLMTAATSGGLCAARWLVQHGADVTLKSLDHARNTALEFALDCENLPMATMFLEECPGLRGSELAAIASRLISMPYPHTAEIAAWLINAGVNPDLKSIHDEPWLVRAQTYEHHICEPLTQLLLQSGADIDATNKKGWTALHQAVQRRYVPGFTMLLRAGADPDLADNDGKTVRSHLSAAQQAAGHGVFKVMHDFLIAWDASRAAQKAIQSVPSTLQPL